MSIESALALIDSVKDSRVLFVGDAITDEYHYVTPLAKSPKENLIPVAYGDKEVFDGGVTAAANHVRSFCAQVDVSRGSTETRKVRYVDKTYLRKLFEVQYRNEVQSECSIEGEYDAVVVADFGHGCLTAEIIRNLCDQPFLAVNAQTNAANLGFNFITKYPRADYIVIDEPEARLAAGDREGHIEDVMHKLAYGRCDRFVVTHGRHGAYGYDHGRFIRQPAFTQSVVDTMGAGDAFYAVTAPMAKTGSMEDLLLIGCAAGALKTQIVGHRSTVTKDCLIAYLKANGTSEIHSLR